MLQIDKTSIVQAIAPAANTGALTGDYISLKNVVKCTIVVYGIWTTTDTSAITIEQATAVAPVGSTAITQVVPIHANLDCDVSNTLAAATSAVSYTTNADAETKIIVFEVSPDLLDDGYDCITVKVGASNTGNIVSALYILDMRYSGADVLSD